MSARAATTGKGDSKQLLLSAGSSGMAVCRPQWHGCSPEVWGAWSGVVELLAWSVVSGRSSKTRFGVRKEHRKAKILCSLHCVGGSETL